MQYRPIPQDYANDIYKGVFGFKQYGEAVYRPQETWKEGCYNNLIIFNDGKHFKELHKHIKLNSIVIPEIREHFITIVKKY